MPSTRPKSRPKQDWMKRADKAFSQHIRARDGSCLAVGTYGVVCSGNLQCCHIIGRGELAIRVNPLNGISMCQAHHMFFTPRVATWHDFVDALLPGRWDELRLLVREHRASMGKVDWKAEVESLRSSAGSESPV